MPSIYYERHFVPGCFYHVYNRGAHQQKIFLDDQDYQNFISILAYYLQYPTGLPLSLKSKLLPTHFQVRNLEKQVPSCTLLAYCLMPNHFHFMIKQLDNDLTISDLMRRLSVTYAMYFNDKYHHSGTILQGKYKNVLVENECQWIYLSKYIHRNPLHLPRSEPKILSDYPYSSYPSYLGMSSEKWLDTSIILSRYPKNPSLQYQNFVEDGTDVGNIEKLTLDVDEAQ